ncbi:MAG: 4-hydroxyphenylpyruvate dioxygenase [Gammaproteobacteria bacterium]|nr:4-hydroxyphenylpyruvate dioxygenase [Gammaproteobacteria bacterium]
MILNKIDNPLGTDGFEFVEFTGPNPAALARQLAIMGFAAVGKHRRKDVTLYRQGDVNFILNAEAPGPASVFAKRHGPSANAMAFRVKDAAHAIEAAERRGAKVVRHGVGPMELNIPAIEGIGGLLIYLVDRYGDRTIYDVDFDRIDVSEGPDASEGSDVSNNAGLTYIDHLTHNLYRGNMDKWAEFYQTIFNFREIRQFDIEGKMTGLISRAMTSPCGKIRIPLNESRDEQSQIEEFLTRYHGEGIQHIALGTDDIYRTVAELRKRGVVFQATPETYYDGLAERVPDHGEPFETMRDAQILIDGSKADGMLLQIFTQDAIGPIFFEIIQRKGNEGFGEGNFQALFESIELDQIRRGVLDDKRTSA